MQENNPSEIAGQALAAQQEAAIQKLLLLQKHLDSSLDVICSIDAGGTFAYVSAAAKEVWGYMPQELVGTLYLDLVYPEDHAKTIATAASIRSGRNVTSFENRYKRKDGTLVPILWSARWSVEDRLMYCVARDLTEKKEAERLEEEKRAAIYDHIQDCFISVTPHFCITHWNKRTEQVLGKKKEAVLGQNLWDVYAEAKNLKFFVEYDRALTENTSVHFEEFLPSLQAWYQVNAYPTASGLDIYFQDITLRKKGEAALKLANERYALASQATSDVLWDWDIATNKCYFNATFNRLFGHRNLEDMVYKNWLDNIHEDDILRISDSVQQALNDPSVSQWEDEYKFYKADKTVACILDKGLILRKENGAAVRMVGSLQDITKLKEATEELERLSLVAKETVNAVIITNVEERIIWVNKAFTDITEYSLEEVLGKKPGELLQGEKTSAETKAYLRRCIGARRPFNCEVINYTKSGHPYWIEIKGQPIFNEHGEVKQFFAIQTDITHRKEVEAAILTSEGKYKLLFYESHLPKWIFDAATLRILDVNRAAIKLYGYSREDFLQLSLQDIKVPESLPQSLAAIEDMKTGRRTAFNQLLQHRKKNGELFFIEVTSHTLQLPKGLCFFSSGMDMTEKIRLEQEVIAEKLAAQKEVSRAIINTQEKERSEVGKELHDNVCQLLTTSKLYFENIKYFADRKDEFAERGIAILQQSINEIRFLSKQLVTPVLNDIGFEATIQELIAHYQAMNVFKINFRYLIKEERIDKELKLAVYRILQELFNNTVKYAHASIVDFTIESNNAVIRLDYSDNGLGFEPATRKNGIGLMNIQNRADAYKGVVQIGAAPGEGCHVHIVFPAKQ